MPDVSDPNEIEKHGTAFILQLEKMDKVESESYLEGWYSIVMIIILGFLIILIRGGIQTYEKR